MASRFPFPLSPEFSSWCMLQFGPATCPKPLGGERTAGRRLRWAGPKRTSSREKDFDYFFDFCNQAAQIRPIWIEARPYSAGCRASVVPSAGVVAGESEDAMSAEE